LPAQVPHQEQPTAATVSVTPAPVDVVDGLRRVEIGGGRPARGGALKKRQHMITNFSAPWRVVEIPSGFAVEDATGK
jgi:hypothetical protein